MNARGTLARQRGMASLVVALVLMMSMTLITVSVARTQLAETHMAGNEQQYGYLRLLAQSAWEKAIRPLTLDTPQLVWQPAGENGSLVSETSPATADATVETRVLYRRSDKDSPVIDVSATTEHAGGNGLAGRVSQAVRLLTVLSPLAESAPPLAINGCLSTAATDIRPINSDSHDAGDAVWRFNSAPCPVPGQLDVHDGGIVDKPLAGDLWRTFFSVDRDDYAALAAADLALPPPQRRYWLADAVPGGTLTWRRSLGTTGRPVVLVFPAGTGCPQFAAGARIFGVVFVDAGCNAPLATSSLEITGSLVVNGAVDTGGARLRLNHIQTADPAQTRLALPVLRTVKIPGSWRDF